MSESQHPGQPDGAWQYPTSPGAPAPGWDQARQHAPFPGAAGQPPVEAGRFSGQPDRWPGQAGELTGQAGGFSGQPGQANQFPPPPGSGFGPQQIPGQVRYQPGMPPTPPPRRSVAKTLVGVLLVLWGVLSILGWVSQAATGNRDMALVHPGDLPATIGSLMGFLLFTVAPLWGGTVLLRSHGKAMDRWRRSGQR